MVDVAETKAGVGGGDGDSEKAHIPQLRPNILQSRMSSGAVGSWGQRTRGQVLVLSMSAAMGAISFWAKSVTAVRNCGLLNRWPESWLCNAPPSLPRSALPHQHGNKMHGAGHPSQRASESHLQERSDGEQESGLKSFRRTLTRMRGSNREAHISAAFIVDVTVMCILGNTPRSRRAPWSRLAFG